MDLKETFTSFIGENIENVKFAINNKDVFIVTLIVLWIVYVIRFMNWGFLIGKSIKKKENKDGSISYFLPPLPQISIKTLFIILFGLIIFLVFWYFWLKISRSSIYFVKDELLNISLFFTIIAIFLFNMLKDNNKLYTIGNTNKHDQIIFYEEYFIYVAYITQYKYKIYYKDVKRLEFIKKYYPKSSYSSIFNNASIVIIDDEKIEVKKMSTLIFMREYPPFIFNWWIWLQDKFKEIFWSSIDIQIIDSRKYRDYKKEQYDNLYKNINQKINDFINK